MPGIRLHAEEWPGRGRPLLCLPGQIGSAHTYAGLAARLAPEHRVIALDPRGRGKSAAPAAGYGYQVHVADTLLAIEHLGLRRPVLVGHSFGGIVALCLAAWAPEPPGALVLIDGGAPIPHDVTAAVDAVATLLDTVYPDVNDYLAQLAAVPWFQPWTSMLAEQLLSLVEPVPGGVRARARAATIQQELQIYADGPPVYPSLWRKVRCPTLVVRARLGMFGLNAAHALPGPDYRRMLAEIPRARGVEVLANHYTVLLGDPAATADAVRAFLTGLD
ncbi:MAG: alpha/beta hydrolase [Dehalococcoidia bacterium]|nr:MAG: alpha/beta hydrolase [Dehalococcoidia bacterium]